MVKGVECIDAQLQSHAFVDREVLSHADIPVIRVRVAHRAEGCRAIADPGLEVVVDAIPRLIRRR